VGEALVELTIDGIKVRIDGLDRANLNLIHSRLADLLAQPGTRIKPRDAIAGAFAYGIELCPQINPSDLWHHVIYREYVRTIRALRGVGNASQSWVRSSGDAFEIFIQDYYNARLAADGVWVTALFKKKERREVLEEMGIHAEVGGSKLDLVIRSGTRVVGGAHAKVSLAERVSDDVPASEAMMRRGFLSALLTLDVKSFPPSGTVSDARAYQNRGELGTPGAPSDKRTYIENHGSFDLCVSYNQRTVPSRDATNSGKRIFTASLGGPPDAFEAAIRARL
jgi:hypothetical protein